ncbi:MAG: phosphatase PAP2 family protein [Candidatus Hodarchaeota archaeon]
MSLIPGEQVVNIFLQSFRNLLLDLFFLLLSEALREIELLILLIIIIWIVERRTGYILALLFLFSNYINWFLKTFFGLSRPYVDFPNDITLIGPPESSYGFPSNHSQNIVSIGSFLAARFKNKWFTLLIILLSILMPLSRLYLGVHYLSDVIGGIFFGFVIVLGYLYFEDRLEEFWDRLKPQQQIVSALLVPILLFAGAYILFPGSFVEGKDPGLFCGALFGGILGILLETRYIKLEREGVPNRIKAVRVLIGVPIVLVTYIVLSLFKFGQTEGLFFGIIRFCRYAVLSLVAVVVCPYIFVKLEKRFFEAET